MLLTSFQRKLYKQLLKPIFFRSEPEAVHDRMTTIGSILGSNRLTKHFVRKLYRYEDQTLVQELFGITFQNPVGLSAGFDKDANLHNILYDVGFGFAEIGSVTWRPYEGNPKPRLFRLKKSLGLVVYYGLKNIGVKRIAEKLHHRKDKGLVLSISVAKTNDKSTASESGGIQDYYECLKHLAAHNIGEIYTINISCPNTFGGEPFTTPDKLDRLLTKLKTVRTKKPIFIKMPINLNWQEFSALLEVIVAHKCQGVVIGNLTKVRDPELVLDEIPEHIKGGISGKPTWELSNNLIRQTYLNYGKQLKIIGVGGIFSAEDAYTKIKLGATLVQLITGMIFEGPQLIGEINNGLACLLKKDGFSSISQAIGVDA